MALATALRSCETSCTLPCASNEVCIADPTPRCVVPNGANPDAYGSVCGGFAGFQCTDQDDDCVDDPRDFCDPDNGSADCIGICVQKPA
ncbi:hypothetical protein VMCG_00062 [Cytospora schulzeri]|uniref:Uncharacterized protein n=1 Tax=Cytospora schulzeri TaxID=448051 RepID=A0A423X8L7_9PEZI|nr:hypothetical protein VMCG_00062 [Valsa malicola]